MAYSVLMEKLGSEENSLTSPPDNIVLCFTEEVGKAIKGKSKSNITETSYTESDKTVISQAIGSIGIVILTLEVILIVIVDFPKIISDIKTGYNNAKNNVIKKLKKKKKKKQKKKKEKEQQKKKQ